MQKQFPRENRKPFWSRLAACIVLGFYLLALVVLPALDRLIFDHGIVISCKHFPSDSNGVPVPDSEKSCPICKFVRLAVPHFVTPDPLLWQEETLSEVSLSVSIPLVVYATVLPPCRAPPVPS
jgi:hypothetical protein